MRVNHGQLLVHSFPSVKELQALTPRESAAATHTYNSFPTPGHGRSIEFVFVIMGDATVGGLGGGTSCGDAVNTR